MQKVHVVLFPHPPSLSFPSPSFPPLRIHDWFNTNQGSVLMYEIESEINSVLM